MQTPNSPTPTDDLEPPRPRLSPVRVGIALIVATIALSGTVVGIGSVVNNAGTVSPPWFAPYVDTTLTPQYDFQDHDRNPNKDVVLGFVVSDPASACTPSWGGAYSLDQASMSLDLDRRIAQLRAGGGDVIASFGGRDGTDLAVGCTDVGSLTSAYTEVVNRYDITTVDLDVEGPALDDTASMQRRAQALAGLQHSERASGHPLAVWLTVPAGTAGMTPSAVRALDTLLAAKVDIAGVNLMTMDFSTAEFGGGDMLGTVEQALGAAHDQVATAYSDAGIGLNSKHVWNHMGVTVMIGQNDVAGERFSVDDAQGLVGFATQRGMARLSMWDINRDSQCGTNFAQVGVLSNTCSGVAQQLLQFTEVFGQVSGDPQAAAGVVATPAALATPTPAVTDDPSTSPYPVWQPDGMYRAGYKVVWRGEVYEAKWFSENFAPDTPGQLAWQTPWELVGPVASGDPPLSIPTDAPGTYPAWSATRTYPEGARVLYQGLPYQAQYYTTGSTPDPSLTNPAQSAWTPLFSIPGEPS